MDKNIAHDIYQECLNMNLSDMLELITSTNSEDEKDFYTEIYNFVLRKRQKECIAKEGSSTC